MLSKKVDIVYFGDLRQVQGINTVTKSFFKGKTYFEIYGLKLNKIVTSRQILNCEKEEFFPIGENINTVKYSFNRKIRIAFKILLNVSIPLFAWIKFKINVFLPAKKAVNRYLKCNSNSDYIIFQDIYTAYHYYNTKIVHKKAILILHGGENPFLQFQQVYSGIFKSRYKKDMEQIFQLVYENINKIVYVSSRACNNSFIKTNKEFIYNGVEDLEEVILENIHSPLNIVCVGSINEHKGQEIIINAVKILDNSIRKKIHIYIVGGGSLEQILRERCAKEDLLSTITFMGVRKDVNEILKKMDVLLLPSVSEGLPMVIIEALRQGLYILTTDTGGTKEMIDEGFGEIITRDPYLLKMKIEEIVKENRITLTSRKLSREHYLNNFTLQQMMKKYANCLNSL